MDRVPVPPVLRDGVGRTAAGREWIGRLPELVGRARTRWELRLGDPFTSGASSWCAPARSADGRPVVVKISFPHDEARDEAAALRAWRGHGVPVLLGHDADDWALLLERVQPGTPLSTAGGTVRERFAAAAEVARALWSVPTDAPVASMAQVGAAWALRLEERGGRFGVPVAAAADLLRTLPGSGGTVVHGDLNPGNVLSAGGGRWLAIDPKPMRGDPAYDLWPLLEQVGDPFAAADPTAVLRTRSDLVAGLLDLDPGRVAAWGYARCTESALWVWDTLGDEPTARRILRRAQVWARLLP